MENSGNLWVPGAAVLTEDLYECTFTPRINRRSDGWDDRVPLHLRTKAIQQYKQDGARGKGQDPLVINPGNGNHIQAPSYL